MSKELGHGTQAVQEGRTGGRLAQAGFARFKEYLAGQELGDAQRAALVKLTPSTLYRRSHTVKMDCAAMAAHVARFLKLPFLASVEPGMAARGELPEEFCKAKGVMAVREEGGEIAFVVSNPFDWEVMSAIQSRDINARFFIAEPASIQALFERPEQSAIHALPPAISEVGLEIMEEYRDETSIPALKAKAGEDTVVRMGCFHIAAAIEKGASDIHIEPQEDGLVVRYRIDGSLYEQEGVGGDLKASLTSWFKITASLDIAERRVPQDGRIQTKYKGKTIDLRVSTLPIRHGEKVVIRILDKSAVPLDLDTLGLEERPRACFREALKKRHGIILVTGPTGSGKTTTLNAALRLLNRPNVNIVTVEDPVEYEQKGINSVQVNPLAGLTFPVALRSILRQDPNIIMIGEMRDDETAAIAIKAALTGHLVLSTLHTNDAPSAVCRLTDMGVDPYLVAATLEMAAAQRLLRKLCPHCKVHAEVPDDVLLRLGVKPAGGTTFFQPAGCEQCMFTGYRGRVAVLEAMPVDVGMKALIERSASLERLRKHAIEHGMTTLREDAMAKAARGITSIEEVCRVTA